MKNLPYNDPAFLCCIREAAKVPELIKEFDRLQGSNLSRKGSSIDLMIDDTTGRTDADLSAFVEFVYEAIYTRLSNHHLDTLRKVDK